MNRRTFSQSVLCLLGLGLGTDEVISAPQTSVAVNWPISESDWQSRISTEVLLPDPKEWVVTAGFEHRNISHAALSLLFQDPLSDMSIVYSCKWNRRTLDLKLIEDDILRISKLFKFTTLGYDHWNSENLALSLCDSGVNCVGVLHAKVIIDPIRKELVRRVKSRIILHDGKLSLHDAKFSGIDSILMAMAVQPKREV